MAGPMAYAAVGGQVLGGIMGYKGARAAGKAQQQIAEYNAQMAENEAVLMARRRRDEESRLRRQGEQLKGAQRVAVAASGVELSGSPLNALADAYYGIATDAAKIQYASEVDQTRAQAEANLRRAEGVAARKAANYQATASLLGGLTGAASTGVSTGVFS